VKQSFYLNVNKMIAIKCGIFVFGLLGLLVFMKGCSWFEGGGQSPAQLNGKISDKPQCDRSIKWVYERSCTGQVDHSICRNFVLAVKSFEIPEQSSLCNLNKISAVYEKQLRSAIQIKNQATGDHRRDPRFKFMVDDQRLRILDDYIGLLVRKAGLRKGKETLAKALKVEYLPLAPNRPIPRTYLAK